jgi:hypothetical protein
MKCRYDDCESEAEIKGKCNRYYRRDKMREYRKEHAKPKIQMSIDEIKQRKIRSCSNFSSSSVLSPSLQKLMTQLITAPGLEWY